MRDVLELVNRVRIRCSTIQDELTKRSGLSPDEQPVGAFGICYNNTVLAVELLDYYYRLWGQIKNIPGRDPESVREENGQRVMMIATTIFVQNLSGIEFGAKQATMQAPQVLGQINGRVYLRKIIQQSVSRSFISSDDEQCWYAIIALRNTLVHNNGIAESQLVCDFPDFRLEFIPGSMIQGNLRLLPQAMLWTVEAFARWVSEFVNRTA